MGWLHDFALDCFRFALEASVRRDDHRDSDQLRAAAGYSGFLGDFLAANPGRGCWATCRRRRARTTRRPAVNARRELTCAALPAQVPQGESQFVHWTFWPSTVFSADAARDLVKLWDGMRNCRTSSGARASGHEEVLFPTLVACWATASSPALQLRPRRYRVGTAPAA
jgi:hypothetical protein